MGNEVFSNILKGKIWDDILPCTYKLRKRNVLANFGQTHDLQKEKEQLLCNSTVSSLSKLKLGFDFDDRSRQGFRYRILNTGIVLQRYI